MSENSQVADAEKDAGEREGEDAKSAAAAPATEAAPAAEAESEDDAPVRIRAKRQWVNLRGNSLDARVGDDLVGNMGNDLRDRKSVV